MRALTGGLDDGDYRLFRRLVEEKSGLHLPSVRRAHLEQGISRALDRSGLREPSALYQRLASDAGRPDLEEFVASLTVGETHFFRNRPQFDALERHVLPDLIERRLSKRRLRIWSAGCSSGEEPYSLAMLLDQILPRIDTWNISILGTDIDRGALKRANTGIYRSWSFRGVPPDIRSHYFIPRGGELELIPRIRAMVNFEYLNLVDDVYPSLLNNTNAIDLVVCRNVLIYFRPKAARSVIARLHRCMVDGAWLLMGHAEPSEWLEGRFSVHSFPGAAAYRKPSEESSSASAYEDRTIRDRPSRRRSLPGMRPSLQRRVPARRKSATGSPDHPGAARTPEDRSRDALALWESGDVDDALVELEALAAEFECDPRPPYLVAKIHAGKLDVEAAQTWSAKSLERDPLFGPTYHLLGVVAAEDGRPEDAIAAFRRCVYTNPAWPLGHFALAEALLRLGEQRRAMSALTTVRRILLDVPPEQEVPEADGLTAGRLRELAEMQGEIFRLPPGSGGDS